MSKIDDAVANGIRKTINRFREKPLYYFTEADLHSSLIKDITEKHSKSFYHSLPKSDEKGKKADSSEQKVFFSLIHQEYPTTFRYSKKSLLEGYSSMEDYKQLEFRKDHNKVRTTRGHYDLAILNPKLVDDFNDEEDIAEFLNKIINKDAEISRQRSNENRNDLLYAIEVKFLHDRNSRNIALLDEIIMDNEKLRLAYYHSMKSIKPIMLIFCSSGHFKDRGNQINEENKKSVINKIKEYVSEGKVLDYKGNNRIQPKEVLNVFVSSYYDETFSKNSEKPIYSKSSPNSWEESFIKKQRQVSTKVFS